MCRTGAFSWQIQVRQLPGSIHLSLNAHICTKWYIWGWFYHPDVGDFNSSFISSVSDSQAPLTYQNTILRAVLLTLAATTKITVIVFLFIWWQIGRKDAAKPVALVIVPRLPTHLCGTVVRCWGQGLTLPLDRSRKCIKLQSLICLCALPRQDSCLKLLTFLLTASEDVEIVVQFWNAKQVKLPRGVALWIPPSLWERIVEMIHMPFTSRVKPRPSQDTGFCIFPCSPKPALISVCAVCSLAKHCLLCSPCWPHFHHHCAGGICCSSAWLRCICCCHPCAAAWWPLPSRSLVFQDKAEEAESSREPSPHLLALTGTKQGEAAAGATSSPSSDSEWNLKPSLTKGTGEGSAVNTGSSCLEKPRLKNSARPEGKYWKRSHHKSHSRNSGNFKQPHREASVRGNKTKTLLGRAVTLPAVNFHIRLIQFFSLPDGSATSSDSSFGNSSLGKLPEQLISFGGTDIPLCFLSFSYAFYDANIFINLHSSSIQNNLKEFLSGLKCIFVSSEMNVSPFQFWFHSYLRFYSFPGPGSCSSTCSKGQLESKAISTGDTSSVAPAQQSAMSETIEQTPRGQTTLKEILGDQDFQPSLRVR